MGYMRNKWVFMPLIALGFLAVLVLGGQVVRLLWNWLVPSIIGWREITFWQGLGLLALCRILFGGFGSRGGGGSGFRRRGRDRWKHMTPEERQRIRARIRDRFDCGPAAGENPPGPAAV